MPHTLTRRELEIGALVCRGEKNSAIAEALGISVHTVNAHRDSIYKKLGVHSAAELAVQMTRSDMGEAAREAKRSRPSG